MQQSPHQACSMDSAYFHRKISSSGSQSGFIHNFFLCTIFMFSMLISNNMGTNIAPFPSQYCLILLDLPLFFFFPYVINQSQSFFICKFPDSSYHFGCPPLHRLQFVNCLASIIDSKPVHNTPRAKVLHPDPCRLSSSFYFILSFCHFSTLSTFSTSSLVKSSAHLILST